MVGTWLLELYLDQLNRSLLEVKGKGEPLPSGSESNGQGQKTTEGAEGSSKALPVPDQLTQDLRAFLKRNVDVLDVNVTVSLLAGYGRLEDLMEYATYRKVSCSKLESFSLTAAAMQCNEAQCDAMHSAQCNALDSSGYFLLCSCWGQISYGHCSCSPPPPPHPPPSHTHMWPGVDVCQCAQAILAVQAPCNGPALMAPCPHHLPATSLSATTFPVLVAATTPHTGVAATSSLIVRMIC